jgi:putative CRISPR-associated protein (TIGR02619 family)
VAIAQPQILICTVGTSLFRPNLEGLKKDLQDGKIRPERRPLAEAYTARDWPTVASQLAVLPANYRTCGAEVNSVASMIEHGHVPADCGLFFLHSDTDDGRSIAAILTAYYRLKDHAPAEAVAVADLQDQDAKRFRTKGLRNLAREICAIIRQRSAAACAINATGGYKAQIAVAVLLGQALGVPVFYKHELFSEIIAFPPLPVALDFEVWLRASGMLFDLERNPQPTPAALFADDWDEKYESLVERVRIDGEDYLELSPTGQIFHETFRERFRSARDQMLPPPVPSGQKRPPRLEKSGWPGEHPDVERFMAHVTADVPQVAQCTTYYYNPDLPERTRFRLGRDGVEGIYSNGNFTVKFRVEMSAQTPGQQAAVVAALNEWAAQQC